jgi:branched-subunit amino acid ABC-type transport system permease component
MIEQLLQLAVNGLIVGTILALTGVGASLVFGIQRVANFAHGEYLTFGAYIGLILNVFYKSDLVTATIVAMAATALLAVALHFLVLRPLRSRGLVAMSLITVGIGLMLRDVVFMVAGPQIRQYAIDQTRVYDLGLVRIAPGQAVAIAWLRQWFRPWRSCWHGHPWASRCGPFPTTAIWPPFPVSTWTGSAPTCGFSLARWPASGA